MYSMLAREWPGIRERLENRLKTGGFSGPV
jgi:hypothetical protein